MLDAVQTDVSGGWSKVHQIRRLEKVNYERLEKVNYEREDWRYGLVSQLQRR